MRRLKKLLILAALSLSLVVFAYWLLQNYGQDWLRYDLPKETLDFNSLKPRPTPALSDSNRHPLLYWGNGPRQFYRRLPDIDRRLVDFVVMLEDAKFYSHSGFDTEELGKAFQTNFEKGQYKRGGSTITQQLAKNLFLDKQKTLFRKVMEIPWTLKLEKDLSKKQILELYLNIIEWGPNVYGVEAASRYFFDKHANQLSLGQAMYLALIIPNPNRFDVLAHPLELSFLEEKRSWLVHRLINEKKVQPEEIPEYKLESFAILPKNSPERVFPDGDNFGPYDVQTILKIKSAFQNRETLLTIDSALLRKLHQSPLVESPGSIPRWFLVREDHLVRALRWLPEGYALDASQFEEAPYEIEEVDTFDLKNLAQDKTGSRAR